jgi:hypothetical protein
MVYWVYPLRVYPTPPETCKLVPVKKEGKIVTRVEKHPGEMTGVVGEKWPGVSGE